MDSQTEESPTFSFGKSNLAFVKHEVSRPEPQIQDIKDGWSKFSQQNALAELTQESHQTGAGFLDHPEKFKSEEQAAKVLLDSFTTDKEFEFKIEEGDRHVDGLFVKLHDHQVHGLRFLSMREKKKVKNKGGMLCDDMGLGKTIQSIALMCSCKPSKSFLKDPKNTGATLIVLPLPLVEQWRREISTKSNLEPFVFHGPKRPKIVSYLEEYDVILTTYETLVSEVKLGTSSPIYQLTFHRCILDEAHRIRNRRTQTFKASMEIKANSKWCLTGTPVQNSMQEMLAFLQFIGHGKLSDEEEWNRQVVTPIRQKNWATAIQSVRNELKPIMLRRTKAVLNNGTNQLKLPPKTVHKVRVELSEGEAEFYREVQSMVTAFKSSSEEIFQIDKNLSALSGISAHNKIMSSKAMLAELHRLYHEDLENSGFSDSCRKISLGFFISCLTRIRQVACHWKLLYSPEADYEAQQELSLSERAVKSEKSAAFESGSVDHLTDALNSMDLEQHGDDNSLNLTQKTSTGKLQCSKLDKMLEILKNSKDRKTIVYSQFTSAFDVMEPELDNHGIQFIRYDGAMSLGARNVSLDKFRTNPYIQVLLCSLKCGSLGLNLVAASQVINFDQFWNPQIHEQAIDRVHRIGQVRDVVVYDLIAKDTVEDKIVLLQNRKKKLARDILDSKQAPKMTTGEVYYLLGIKNPFAPKKS